MTGSTVGFTIIRRIGNTEVQFAAAIQPLQVKDADGAPKRSVGNDCGQAVAAPATSSYCAYASRIRSRTFVCAVVSTIGRSSAKERRSRLTT